jgi:hypothetical protein
MSQGNANVGQGVYGRRRYEKQSSHEGDIEAHQFVLFPNQVDQKWMLAVAQYQVVQSNYHDRQSKEGVVAAERQQG